MVLELEQLGQSLLHDAGEGQQSQGVTRGSSVEDHDREVHIPHQSKKRSFLYSAVSSPLDRSKRFTLFALPDRPVHSDTNSASPGSILARQHVRAKTKSLTFPSHSIAMYSFIQLSQQGRQWRERKCPIFETVAEGIRTRAHLIASPTFYH